MKKIFCVNFILLFFVFNVFAQINMNVQSGFVRSDVYSQIDNGFNVSLGVGYKYKKINSELNIQRMRLNLLEIEINSIKLNTTYFFIDKNVKPYLGLEIGYFEEKLGFSIYSFSDKAIGLAPNLGCIFQVGIKNLFITPNVSYGKIFFDNELDLFQFNLGLKYLFNF